MDCASPLAPPDPVPPAMPGGPRPPWSVMLPTCEPDGWLRQALASVLEQAPPAAEMQIAVIDDHSRSGDLERLVRSVDPAGRVEVVRHEQRLGLAGNWNRAVAAARGHLVHLLHQDDYVLPGFYPAMTRAFRRDDVGMAVCRSRIVDGDGHALKTSSRLRWLAGPLDDWLATIAVRQRVQTPAVVVRRATYEALGGFRTDLCMALDWEMWVRIAARHRVWYVPRPLAAYRRHEGNESARLHASGAVWPDLTRAIECNARSLPPARARALVRASARWHARSALRTVAQQASAANALAAWSAVDFVRSMLDLAADDGLRARCLEAARLAAAADRGEGPREGRRAGQAEHRTRAA